MELSVLNIEGKDTGKKVSLETEVFGIEPNTHAVYLDVKRYLAAQRQGTHKAKERGEIKGSTKKIKKQKGTGTARFGDIKNPLFRGGGRVFGPRPRSYDIKINKSLKKVARKSALSSKVSDGKVSVVEQFSFDEPSTKKFAQILTNFNTNNEKILLVLGESNKNVYLSSRNLKGVKVITASDLNTYDVLGSGKILLIETSLDKIHTSLR